MVSGTCLLSCLEDVSSVTSLLKTTLSVSQKDQVNAGRGTGSLTVNPTISLHLWEGSPRSQPSFITCWKTGELTTSKKLLFSSLKTVVFQVIFVGGATIITSDIAATNGVIHLINKVRS